MENGPSEMQTVECSVESIVGLLRLQWKELDYDVGSSNRPLAERSVMEFSARLAEECPKVPRDACNCIAEQWWNAQRFSEQAAAPASFQELCRVLLPAHVYPEDARYFAMRSIRRSHEVALSSATSASAHHLVSVLNESAEYRHGGFRSYKELADKIGRSLEAGAFKNVAARILGAFIDVALVLGLLEYTVEHTLALGAKCSDAEYLMNHLFGFPTRIPGFDALFDGGGLMLTDSPLAAPDAQGAPATNVIGGRSILCIGPFGTGKTLLSLQFAVEVARKGGVAWVITFEQTEEECLYALESIGVSTRHPGYRTIRGGLTESFLALSHPTPGQGALVFLRPTEQKIDYAEFLVEVEKRLSWMSSYCLRLLVVDPVNAFLQPVDARNDLRTATRHMFDAAKTARVNTWLTSESLREKPEANRFEENIADTVIHLGSENTPGQQRRYIEITKSRFQQESPGRHGFVIESESGLRIYPPSALIANSVSDRMPQPSDTTLSLGVPGIERLLGPEPIRSGDILVLGGPGKGKSLMGAHFLLPFGGGEDDSVGAAYFSDHPRSRMDRVLSATGPRWRERSKHIERCSLPTGYIEPGRILQKIQMTLERCTSKNGPTSRVLLANLSRWEEEMPFVAADASFGVALVRLLRGYNIAALIVSGDELDRGSHLRDTLFDQSDVLVQFHRHELQGRATTLINAVKSRFMQHQRESFELCLEASGLSVRPAPLFRIRASGDAEAVKISLFLHAETDNHKRHNDRMVEGLRATISDSASIETQTRKFDPGLLTMSQYSAIDELQIFQIDEFQLPGTPSAALPVGALYSFDAKLNQGLLADRLPEFCKRVRSSDGKQFFAVPFYANLSFLAVHRKKFSALQKKFKWKRFPGSWSELGRMCEQFASSHGKPKELLFSCAVYDEGIETYNCLFLEILHSLQPPTREDFEDLAVWFGRPAAVEAAVIFRQLCKSSDEMGYMKRSYPEGIISRHWYNTLNQALSQMTPARRAEIDVRPLFDEITTAGEWYLSIPTHSASPEVGLRLIEYLTAPDSETSRVELGVGLPTRTAYFEAGGANDVSVSRYFRMSRSDVRRILSKAIRRSEFRLYQRVASTISSRLRWILEIPDLRASKPATSPEIRAEIERMMRTLTRDIRFLSQSAGAAETRTSTKAGSENS
jgi:KaiC/GvpD/RAD55 family RecA-like ATPase